MNHDLFKRAIEIIRAVPEKQIDLRLFQFFRIGHDGLFVTTLKEADCGTLCCAGGWLALDPEMQKAGLYVDPVHGAPALDFSNDKTRLLGVDALAAFFDIKESEASALFSPRKFIENCYFGAQSQCSDKELWLRRAESFTSNRERFRNFFVFSRSDSTP
jgi:hypothetical protein